MNEEIGSSTRTIDKNYLETLKMQYEFVSKHLEYHDSNVFKVISVFFAFCGLYLANLDEFDRAWLPASILAVFVGIVFALLLHRTSNILTDYKITLIKIDYKIKDLVNNNYDIASIPPRYLAGKNVEISQNLGSPTKNFENGKVGNFDSLNCNCTQYDSNAA